MQKVIPPGLNYADIKPEAIENYVRIVKFTPQQNIVSGQPGEVIRFMLQGNGFYDPYSAYIRITVSPGQDFTGANAPAADYWAARLLDRSAHSLFSRLVIRCQGTELERIEQYDVMAAMLNDMVYSQEYKMLHHFEGLPSNDLNRYPEMSPVLSNNALGAMYMFHGTCGNTVSAVGEVGWWRVGATHDTAAIADGTGAIYGTGGNATGLGAYRAYEANRHFQSVKGGVPQTGYGAVGSGAAGAFSTTAANNIMTVTRYNGFSYTGDLTFIIPIYSGIIGVLMPEKKLLPLSLMPLEVEFTLNPHAFYGAGTNAYAPSTRRDYSVKKFEIFTHTLFFEQELHRSMESIVAEHGIFIHYNSFYLAPVTAYQGVANADTPSYAQINTYAKSINSIHFVFLKQGYEAPADAPRKLQFLSQSLRRLQIRNGLDLIPSEPIEGLVEDSETGLHTPFMIELYKAFNKMHDPSTDSSLNYLNYTINAAFDKPTTIFDLFQQQLYLPRSYYAITLEGETLGEQKAILTGRKGMQPFDINFNGTIRQNGNYLIMIYTRADYICYIRPDLVVTRLGV